jgi:hypothetical protein
VETAESFGSKSFGSKVASRSVHVPHNSRMALTLPPNRGPDAGHREVSRYPDEEQRFQPLRKPFRVEELYAALDKALSSGESGQRSA